MDALTPGPLGCYLLKLAEEAVIPEINPEPQLEVTHSGTRQAPVKHAPALLKKLTELSRNRIMPWQAGRRIKQANIVQTQVGTALAGTALGALIGSVWDEKNRVRGALTGAGLGGALGAGAGYLASRPEAVTGAKAQSDAVEQDLVTQRIKQHEIDVYNQQLKNQPGFTSTLAQGLLQGSNPVQTAGKAGLWAHLAAKLPLLKKIPGVSKVLGSGAAGLGIGSALNYEATPEAANASMKNMFAGVKRPWYVPGASKTENLGHILNHADNAINFVPSAFAGRTVANIGTDLHDASVRGGGSIAHGLGIKMDEAAKPQSPQEAAAMEAGDNWAAAKPGSPVTNFLRVRQDAQNALHGATPGNENNALETVGSPKAGIKPAVLNWARNMTGSGTEAYAEHGTYQNRPEFSARRLNAGWTHGHPGASDFTAEVRNNGGIYWRDKHTNALFQPSISGMKSLSPDVSKSIMERADREGRPWFGKNAPNPLEGAIR